MQHTGGGIDTGSSLAQRLKQGRLACGLSTRAVAEKLARLRVGVSHATVASYERGVTRPSGATLAALADVYGKPVTWFLESRRSLTGIRYRNLRSKVKVGERHQYEASVQRWLEGYAAIEAELSDPLGRSLHFRLGPTMSAADAAHAVRKALDLSDEQPVSSVIEVLEAAGIRAIEMDTPYPIDGLSARWGDWDVVVLTPSTSNDRTRMDAAHELFHVLLGDCDGETDPSYDKPKEARAFEAASLLLLPRQALRQAFVGKSMVRLVKFKEKYGISLAAMVYAATREGLLSASEARWLWIEFSKRGWRKREPGHVREDRARRFETLIDEAHSDKGYTWTRLSAITGVREDELRLRIANSLAADEEPLGKEDSDEPHRFRFVN